MLCPDFGLRLGPPFGIQWKLLRHAQHLLANLREHRGVGPVIERVGVPMPMPLGFIGGFVSNGIAFLLTVIPASPRAFSASLPSMPFANTSTSMRCVSVPPETMR